MGLFNSIKQTMPETKEERKAREKSEAGDMLKQIQETVHDISVRKFELETKVLRAVDRCRADRAQGVSNRRMRDHDAELKVYLSQYWYAVKLSEELEGFSEKVETAAATAEFIGAVKAAEDMTDRFSGRIRRITKGAMKDAKELSLDSDQLDTYFARIAGILNDGAEAMNPDLVNYVPDQIITDIISGRVDPIRAIPEDDVPAPSKTVLDDPLTNIVPDEPVKNEEQKTAYSFDELLKMGSKLEEDSKKEIRTNDME